MFRFGPAPVVRAQLMCLFFLLMMFHNVYMVINVRSDLYIFVIAFVTFGFNAFFWWNKAQERKRPPRETIGEFFRKHMPEEYWCDGCKKFSRGPFCPNCK